MFLLDISENWSEIEDYVQEAILSNIIIYKRIQDVCKLESFDTFIEMFLPFLKFCFDKDEALIL